MLRAFTRSSALLLTLVLGPGNLALASIATKSCPEHGNYLQVLGSGGPEADDGLASSGYLIWLNGKARILVDVGGGVPLRFEQARANFADLDAIIFTHFHVDHSAGLPALVKASYFGSRARDLFILGPRGNDYLPSPSQFLHRLFSAEGVYPYLSDYLQPGQASYALQAIDIDGATGKSWQQFENKRFKLTAISVHHGPLPALAWRVDLDGSAITFSGDTSARSDELVGLASSSTLLVAHHAIPEGAQGAARLLHMPPSRIGVIAAQAKVGKVVLSHHMRRTQGNQRATVVAIRSSYEGPVLFAKDLECFPF